MPVDGVVDGALESSYEVGDTVTFTCNSGQGWVKAECLSDGQWTDVPYVCGGETLSPIQNLWAIMDRPLIGVGGGGINRVPLPDYPEVWMNSLY